MKLSELSVGTDLTLYVTINGKQPLLFETKLIEILPKKRLILADAVIRNNKVLSFKGEGISVNVIATMPEEKPLLFRNVTVESLKLAENSYCYNLVTTADGIPYNRRENFRCFIGNNSVLFIGREPTNTTVTIRDVSVSGFSITCDSDLDLPNNQMIHVDLNDHLEETDEKYKFSLYGVIVRKQELEHGKIVYGCRQTRHIGGLESYLTKKERLRIRKARSK